MTWPPITSVAPTNARLFRIVCIKDIVDTAKYLSLIHISDLMMVGKPSPNQTTINNLTESQTKGVSGGPSAPYGRYGNIFLSQTEYDELQAEYPDRLERFIEEMSRYLAANGKSYQNYAAALRIWAGNDKKEAPKKGIPDYSCKEGESL